MNRLDAIEQYEKAQSRGKKYYNAALSRGEDPHPKVLEDMIDMTRIRTMPVGIIEIPIDRIIGTWSGGRKEAFAGNFMPLLDEKSEFCKKWVDLCEAHLGESGITDPIIAYEYLGDFYVKEGNKRVSVLSSFDATEVTGNVTRLIPPLTDDPKIKRYYEFLDFYKHSRMYEVTFSHSGSYTKLQELLGYEPDEIWTDEARWEFTNVFLRFETVFKQLNHEKLNITPGDALLLYLEVHPYGEMRDQTKEEMREDLKKLWPDVRLYAKGEPVDLRIQLEEKGKSIRSLILGAPKLNIAFFYDLEPKDSSWVTEHDQGRKYLTEKLGGEVKISAHVCDESGYELMERLVAEGVNVIFATSHKHTQICRRLAAEHPNIAIFNCTPLMTYAGVRSYYCRSYEGKFIAGAVAGVVSGSIAHQDRIGYVCNYPIIGDTTNINAFALGARLTNPRARIILRWSCLPGDPIQELTDMGIRVISNQDPDNMESRTKWGAVTFQPTQGGDPQPLISTRCSWGVYYEKTVRSLLNSGVEALRDNSNAVNDWWGLRSGAMAVVINECLPEGVKELAAYLKAGIISRDIRPFKRMIHDQQGNLVNDGSNVPSLAELRMMDWLCENVDGTIPRLNEVLPWAKELVKLLGIHHTSDK